jgi:YjbE family integral membrane protein
MTEDYGTLALRIIEIIWINLLLSGDNAIVIALACRGLPEEQRRLGTLLGTGAAVILRVVFALLVTQFLGLPYLKFAGGLLLLWIGVKLVTDETEHEVKASANLRQAVVTIAIADAVMSLDNVLAIVAAAHGSTAMIIFGLAISIPLVAAGSHLILKVIDRFPALIWIGAALIGWVAGEIMAGESLIAGWDAASAMLMIVLVLFVPVILKFNVILRFFIRYPALLWLFGAVCGWAGNRLASDGVWVASLSALPLHNLIDFLPAFGAVYVVALARLVQWTKHAED